MHYNHLDYTKRKILEHLIRNKMSKTEIAKILCCSRATIYNELKRGQVVHQNSDLSFTYVYDAFYAEAKYQKHLRAKGQTPKIEQCPELRDYLKKCLTTKKMSPQASLYDIKNKNLDFGITINSYTTLYNNIKNNKIPNIKMSDLPHNGKHKYKKSHKRKNSHTITKRKSKQ